MNIDALKAAGIDYERGVKRFVGRAHLYEKALRKFPQDGTFARMRADYEKNDLEALLADAHEFKGMCGNIALPSLFEASDGIVQMLRGGAFSPDALDDAFLSLARAYEAARAAILSAWEGAQ